MQSFCYVIIKSGSLRKVFRYKPLPVALFEARHPFRGCNPPPPPFRFLPWFGNPATRPGTSISKRVPEACDPNTRLEMELSSQLMGSPVLGRGETREGNNCVLRSVMACFGVRYLEIDVPGRRVGGFPRLGRGKCAEKRQTQEIWLAESVREYMCWVVGW